MMGAEDEFEYRAAIVMGKDNQPESMMGSFAPFQRIEDAPVPVNAVD